MKVFFRKIACAAAGVVLVAAMSSCVDVDNTLGLGFIPEEQLMTMRVDTLGEIETYLARTDSIPAHNLGRLYVGSTYDQVFGQTECGFMAQFFPYYSKTIAYDRYYGYQPVFDSLRLVLRINKIHGRGDVEQTFNVYALQDSLRMDSAYLFNTPLESLVDLDKPIFQFTLKDETEKTNVIKKLEPIAPQGVEFVQKIIETDSTILANPDFTFHRRFYGLYVAPAPGSPADAAVYDIGIEHSTTSAVYSFFTVYAHNHYRNSTMVKDTLEVHYYFDDDTAPNLNVVGVKHNYPASIAAYLNDTLPTDATQDMIYAQGLGGVVSYLRFDDDLRNEILDLKYKGGETYSEIVINQAKLYVTLDDPTLKNLDAAPNRLGMYYKYMGYAPMNIVDYQYSQEMASSSSVFPYGGYLKRSEGLGYYSMDITGYIIRLLNPAVKVPETVWLGPEVYSRTTYNQVALHGYKNSDHPIRIVLTYTLVK